MLTDSDFIQEFVLVHGPATASRFEHWDVCTADSDGRANQVICTCYVRGDAENILDLLNRQEQERVL